MNVPRRAYKKFQNVGSTDGGSEAFAFDSVTSFLFN